ncbi:MAG: potassium-transporting ATPase subunit KdpA [Acidimicrobiia bacterium]
MSLPPTSTTGARTSGRTFGAMLLVVMVAVGGVTFLPALILGAVLDQPSS